MEEYGKNMRKCDDTLPPVFAAYAGSIVYGHLMPPGGVDGLYAWYCLPVWSVKRL